MSVAESPRRAADFAHARLVVNDFDGTVVQTFEKSPGGIDVNVAYEKAIRAQGFDPEKVDQFYQQGGLNNRAPLEVARFFAPDAAIDDLLEISAQITADKLKLLMAQVGTRFSDGDVWPRPMPGFLEFHRQVERARSEGRLIDDTVLSSGHTSFISKTYETWGIEQPTELISTEKMQELGRPLLIKPDPLLMGVAFQLWADTFGLSLGDISPSAIRQQTISIGDGEVDEDLAKSSGVKNFERITRENSSEVWARTAGWLDLQGVSDVA